jgi:hypothetical protein
MSGVEPPTNQSQAERAEAIRELTALRQALTPIYGDVAMLARDHTGFFLIMVGVNIAVVVLLTKLFPGADLLMDLDTAEFVGAMAVGVAFSFAGAWMRVSTKSAAVQITTEVAKGQTALDQLLAQMRVAERDAEERRT